MGGGPPSTSHEALPTPFSHLRRIIPSSMPGPSVGIEGGRCRHRARRLDAAPLRCAQGPMSSQPPTGYNPFTSDQFPGGAGSQPSQALVARARVRRSLPMSRQVVVAFASGDGRVGDGGKALEIRSREVQRWSGAPSRRPGPESRRLNGFRRPQELRIGEASEPSALVFAIRVLIVCVCVSATESSCFRCHFRPQAMVRLAGSTRSSPRRRFPKPRDAPSITGRASPPTRLMGEVRRLPSVRRPLQSVLSDVFTGRRIR